MSQVSRNIYKLYLVKVSKWFNLVMPVLVLFYQRNGMNMQEIFILKAIYSVAIVIMEIPSGWMADVWGRKKTLVLGSFLGSAGFLLYCFSYDFAAFVIAEIILGIGYSFVSGADSALLYDSLKAQDKADQYVKQEGRITSAGNFAEAIAGVAGGFLAAISIRYPFYFQFAVASIAIPASLTLVEPRLHTAVKAIPIKLLVRHIRTILFTNQNLRISILLSAVTGTATLTFAWLVQPYFIAIDLSVEWFGILWTALNLSVALSSVFAWRVEHVLNRRQSVFLIIVLLTAGFMLPGIAVASWGLIWLFMFYLVRGVATPILKNYINQHTGSDVRATMLSVRNFMIRITFAITGPLLGWTTDNIGLGTAFMLAGAIYLIPAVIIAFPWLKENNNL